MLHFSFICALLSRRVCCLGPCLVHTVFSFGDRVDCVSDYEQEMVQCEKQGVYLTPDMYAIGLVVAISVGYIFVCLSKCPF